MSTAVDPISDPARIYPSVGAAQAALYRSDWAQAKEIFRAANAYEQHLITDLTESSAGCEGFLMAMVQADPADVIAATMLARRHVAMAWQARGDGPGSQVPPDAAKIFLDHLFAAEQLLIRVCAQNPGFAPAWNVRLLTARGLGMGISESQRRYAKLSKVSHNDFSAQFHTLQNLLPKWGGTWELAHDFVWRCVSQAPPGAPTASLVVTYFQEQWLAGEWDNPAQLFTQAEPMQELRSAGEYSVMNPSFAGGPGWVHALSQFAFAYSFIGDWPRAQSCFSRLGQYLDEWGWAYLNGGARANFIKIGRQAMEQR